MARPEIIKTDLGQRLRDVRRSAGNAERAGFAQLLGFSAKTLANYERGDTQPDASALFAYRRIVNANVDWLVSGEGEMFLAKNRYSSHGKQLVLLGTRSPEAEAVLSGSHTGPADIHGLSEEPDYAQIRKYTVSAGAGNGAINYANEPDEYYVFDRGWIVANGLKPKNLMVITITGDSMEPTLRGGDLILLDRDQTEVRDGKTYVVRLGNELVVKNVQRLGHNQITLLSANTFYPPRTIDLPEGDSGTIQIIGRVVASMHEW